jgi:ABC-2 type transport system permease protein
VTSPSTSLPLARGERPAAAAEAAPVAPSPVAAFGALMRRDLHVMRRELPFLLLRTLLQPLLLTFVLGGVLPRMGFMRGDYGAALLPGILAMSLALSAVQSVALPLVQDFGFTREIEDRLLAPIPTWLLALQKVVAGAVQGIAAGAVVLPVARVILGPVVAIDPSGLGALLLVTVLGALTFSTLGLWVGTAISPQQVGLMFSFIVSPMLIFGCAYYPWRGLDGMPLMQVGVLLDPLTYVAEGLRAAIVPGMPHMPLAAAVAALCLLTGAFWALGYRTFRRRAFG